MALSRLSFGNWDFAVSKKGDFIMKMISKNEIRKLYAVASVHGLVGRDHDDDLHLIIYNMFKKESVKDLTENQYKKVLKYLDNLTNNTENGMITNKQKQYVNTLMQKLAKVSPSKTSNNERLAGIVHKHLNMTAIPQEPLIWVTKRQAQKLIIVLKDYIEFETKKGGKNGTG